MKKKVYAYLHTHWDPEWYRDKEDFDIRFEEIFEIVLDELKNNRAPFFYLDGQTAVLEDYFRFHPQDRLIVKELIKKEKLAIGPYFVSADSYLINFRSMMKNLEIGKKISAQYGQKDFIGYMSDLFGISKSAFCALELNSINKAIIWRGVNPKKINNNCNFKYGNIQTVWLAQGYFNDFCHSADVKGLEKYLDKISKYSLENCLLPIGADHLGMLKNADSVIEDINSKLKNYKIILTSPFEYFKNNKFEQAPKCEEFLDNSDTYILSGVYSARIEQKILNAQVQNMISRIVEPLNFYLGDKYEKNIEYIYETLLKNHAHDGIYGCSIDCVHNNTLQRYRICQNALNALLDRIVGNFKKKYNIKGRSSNKIGLFNLSNCDNIKTVELNLPYIIPNAQVIGKETAFPKELLYDIYKIPITEDLAPIYRQIAEISKNKRLSFNIVEIKKPEKKIQISKNTIENKNIKLEIKNKEIIIQNKKTLKNFKFKLCDIKDEGDSYNFSPKGEYAALFPQKTKILYDGLIQSALRIYFKNIVLDVSLDNHSEFLNFETEINNKTKNHKLVFALELENPITKTLSSDALGTIERKIDSNYKMQDFMPAKRPFELKTNSFPMQNFVIVQGTAVLTKGLHEYEIYKNELRICLLRCFSTISNPKNKTRAIPAGPDIKTPEAQCIGVQKANFALLFADKYSVFSNLDIFLKNYITTDGDFRGEINFRAKNSLDIKEKFSYIYGISENKKISYNIKNKQFNITK